MNKNDTAKKIWIDPAIETLDTGRTRSGGGEYDDGDVAKGPDPGS